LGFESGWNGLNKLERTLLQETALSAIEQSATQVFYDLHNRL
jgi:hypothetical protein